MNEVTIVKLETIIKLLGDKSRLKILYNLKGGEQCVCNIVDNLNISQPAVSQHLRKMRNLGLIEEEKRGQWIYYRLNKNNEYFNLVQQILEILN